MSAQSSPLAAEARQRIRWAPAAALAGALLVVAAAIQLGGPHAKVNEITIGLIEVAKRGSLDIIGGILNMLALLLIAGVLAFLWQATKLRQPALGPYIRALGVLGGVVTGVAGLIYAVIVHGKAHQFVSHGSQTYPQAKALTQGFAFTVLPTLELAAALALAVGIVLVSLGAMRVGLLNRFMGYLGIITGVLVLIPIGSPVPVVEGFWLVALGALFAGRWPSGMPKAWVTGQAEPWPTAQEQREQRVRAASQRGGAGARAMSPREQKLRARVGGSATPTASPEAPAQDTLGEAPAGGARSGPRKRKRKHRR